MALSFLCPTSLAQSDANERAECEKGRAEREREKKEERKNGISITTIPDDDDDDVHRPHARLTHNNSAHETSSDSLLFFAVLQWDRRRVCLTIKNDVCH